MPSRNTRLIFLVVLTILSGCGSTTRTVYDESVHTGTKGLEMTFLKNYPANRIDEQSVFDIAFEMENAGASDIEDGMIQIIVDPPLSFIGWDWGSLTTQGQDPSTPFYLEGRSKSNLVGDRGIVTARLRSAALPLNTQIMHPKIFINTCYAYESIFSKEVCIDPNPLPGSIGEETCTVKDVTSSGQGGPVGVSKVEVLLFDPNNGDRFLGYSGESDRYTDVGTELVQPEFRIYIKNFDDGNVINAQHVSLACGEGSEGIEFNKVDVQAFIFDNELECSEPTVYLSRDDNSYLSCWPRDGVRRKQSSYYAPLVVKMQYGYVDYISKSVDVHRKFYEDEDDEPIRPVGEADYHPEPTINDPTWNVDSNI